MTKHTDTSRSGDLVKRLRVNDAEIYLPILGQAADRIEELASMEECLTAELGDANDRIEALEAEVERLRETLAKIAALTRVRETRSHQSEWTQDVARAALGEKQ